MFKNEFIPNFCKQLWISTEKPLTWKWSKLLSDANHWTQIVIIFALLREFNIKTANWSCKSADIEIGDNGSGMSELLKKFGILLVIYNINVMQNHNCYLKMRGVNNLKFWCTTNSNSEIKFNQFQISINSKNSSNFNDIYEFRK